MDKGTIENNFQYHPVKDREQGERYINLRSEAKRFATLIKEVCPESREKSLAFTKLEEAVFWAKASIARNEQ